MNRATLNRPTESTPTTAGAETTKAIVQDEYGTAPGDVLRLAEIDTPAERNRSIRKASITAGVGLLLMSALSGFGYLVAVKGLVTQGDAARTAKEIMGSEGLFRFG